MTISQKRATRDVPRWSLWLVAVVCFGPLVLVWLLGLIMVPLWAGMLAFQLAEPERFAHELSGSIVDFIWPIGVVIAGFVGIVGMLRVLTLSRRERPKRHRVFTLGMVAVGLAGLAIFDLPLIGSFADVSDVSDVADGAALVRALAIYLVLPFGGAAWLLAKSWKFLVAA